MGFEEIWGNFKKDIKENTDPKIKEDVKSEKAIDDLLADTGVVTPEK